MMRKWVLVILGMLWGFAALVAYAAGDGDINLVTLSAVHFGWASAEFQIEGYKKRLGI